MDNVMSKLEHFTLLGKRQILKKSNKIMMSYPRENCSTADTVVLNKSNRYAVKYFYCEVIGLSTCNVRQLVNTTTNLSYRCQVQSIQMFSRCNILYLNQ